MLQFELQRTEDILEVIRDNRIDSDAYVRLVKTLSDLRRRNNNVKYVYIFYPTEVTDVYKFVADADGLSLGERIDFNGDGILGPEDEIPVPGMDYNISNDAEVIRLSLDGPVSTGALTDQWGTFISGFAPIHDKSGRVIAILGIDKLAEDVYLLTSNSFEPFFYFSGVFALLVIFRLSVLHINRRG